MIPWILIAIFILVILLAIAALILKKGKTHKPSYKTFFIIGISWIPLGVAMDFYALSGIGLVFTIVGLMNRDKWEDEPKWEDMPEEQKRLKIILIAGLTLMLVMGVIAFFLLR